jgi:hypothetical protein
MTILNLYQIAFLTTVVATAMLARWSYLAKHAPMSGDRRVPTIDLSSRHIHACINALDRLFDENQLSTDEYVELRRRIVNGSDQTSAQASQRALR